MNTQSINQKKALELLKKGEHIGDYEVQFDEEKVEAFDALLLRKHGVPLPEDLVFYADEDIVFDEDPDIQPNDQAEGRLLRILRAEISVEPEVGEWVNRNHIDVNKLLSDLMKVFYQNLRSVGASTK